MVEFKDMSDPSMWKFRKGWILSWFVKCNVKFYLFFILLFWFLRIILSYCLQQQKYILTLLPPFSHLLVSNDYFFDTGDFPLKSAQTTLWKNLLHCSAFKPFFLFSFLHNCFTYLHLAFHQTIHKYGPNANTHIWTWMLVCPCLEP